MKLTFIMASKKYLDFIDPFTQLSGVEIELAILGDWSSIPSKYVKYPIKVFQPVQDMPGYFRGLNDHIKETNIIITFDVDRRSSFQSLSLACHLNVPLVLIQTSQSAPEVLSNDSSDALALSQVIRSSEWIFSIDERSEEFLLAEGVKSSKMSRLSRVISSNMQYADTKRQKFRDYIGINERTVFILVLADSREDFALLALQSLKFLLRKNPLMASRIKMMISLEDCNLDNIKLLAADLGIATNVMILQQDLSNFKQDLFCSADLILEEEPGQKFLDALACGVLPVLKEDVGESVVQDIPHVICEGGSFQAWGDALSEAVKLFLHQGRSDDLEHFRLTHSMRGKAAKELRGILESVMKGFRMDVAKSLVNYDDLRFQFLDRLTGMTDTDFTEIFSQLQLAAGKDSSRLAEAMRLQGEHFYKSNRLTEALDSFDKAIQLDSNNWRAYLGLGRVSLRSHSEEEALAFFKKVLAIKPHQVEALSGVGTVHRMIGMADEAIFWFHKALSLDIKNQKILYELTQASLECEDYASAVSILESWWETFQDNNALIMALGKLYLNNGSIEKGQELVSLALNNRSGDGVVKHSEKES